MNLEETLKKFFTPKDNPINPQKQEDEIIQSLALAACEDKHKILIECYKTSWVRGCQSEMDSFWKCVNDKKILLAKKAKSFQNNNHNVTSNESSQDR